MLRPADAIWIGAILSIVTTLGSEFAVAASNRPVARGGSSIQAAVVRPIALALISGPIATPLMGRYEPVGAAGRRSPPTDINDLQSWAPISGKIPTPLGSADGCDRIEAIVHPGAGASDRPACWQIAASGGSVHGWGSTSVWGTTSVWGNNRGWGNSNVWGNSHGWGNSHRW